LSGHHEGGDHLAPAVIGQADHDHGGDGRAAGERALDLVRVEVLAA
jgi:hypothetical protein